MFNVIRRPDHQGCSSSIILYAPTCVEKALLSGRFKISGERPSYSTLQI